MKKTITFALALVLCVCAVFAASSAASSSSQSRPVVSTELSTLATPIYRVELYDTKTITQQEVNEAISYYSAQLGYAVTEEEVIDDLVSTTLVNQAIEKDLKDGKIDIYNGDFNDFVSYRLQVLAANYGVELKSEEDATNFLSQFGMTYNNFAEELLTEWATEKYIDNYSGGKLSNISTPSNAEIQEFFDSNRTMFVSDEYVMPAHIFFSTGEGKNKAEQQRLANTVYNNIRSGRISFEKAVSDYSEDDGSRDVGGNLNYWVSRSDEDMVAAFGDAALKALFALKKGEVSSVVEGPQGFHIFKCLDRNDARLLSLDDKFNPNANSDSYTVRYLISQQLRANKYQQIYLETYAKAIEDLKSRATLKSLKK